MAQSFQRTCPPDAPRLFLRSRPTPELSGAAGKPRYEAQCTTRVRLSDRLGAGAGDDAGAAWLFSLPPPHHGGLSLRSESAAPPPVEPVLEWQRLNLATNLTPRHVGKGLLFCKITPTRRAATAASQAKAGDVAGPANQAEKQKRRNLPTPRPKADAAARLLMHRLAPRLLGIAAGQNKSKAPRRNLRPMLNAWCKRTPRRRKLKMAIGCDHCASPFGAA